MVEVEKYKSYREIISTYNWQKINHRVNDLIVRGDANTVPIIEEQIESVKKKHEEYFKENLDRAVIRTKISIDTVIG